MSKEKSLDEVKKIWPEDNPFPTLGHDIIKYLKNNLNTDIIKNFNLITQ